MLCTISVYFNLLRFILWCIIGPVIAKFYVPFKFRMCVPQVWVKYCYWQLGEVGQWHSNLHSLHPLFWHCHTLYKINLKLKCIIFSFKTFIFKEIKRKNNVLYFSHTLFSPYSMSSCRFNFPCLIIYCSAGR